MMDIEFLALDPCVARAGPRNSSTARRSPRLGQATERSQQKIGLPLPDFRNQISESAGDGRLLHFYLHFGKFDLRAGLKQNSRLRARWLITKDLAERGGFEPPLECLVPKTV